MKWRSLSVSPVRVWNICGAIAGGANARSAATDEEFAVLVAEGYLDPLGRLTLTGRTAADLSPETIVFRQRQWKLHNPGPAR